MPREKMMPKLPGPEARTPEESLERMKDLTRRLIAVPKADLPAPKKKRKHR